MKRCGFHITGLECGRRATDRVVLKSTEHGCRYKKFLYYCLQFKCDQEECNKVASYANIETLAGNNGLTDIIEQMELWN